MRDQASELRSLVLRSLRQSPADSGPAPRLVVLTGGKGGVGTTTLAVNLAVAMSQIGSRVVLVDADLYRGDVAALCGLEEQLNVADVTHARRDIHEVLQRGPAGIQVVPGVWAPQRSTELTLAAQRRLIQQFKTLGRHADIVLLDVGSGSSDVVGNWWHAADEIVLITTPDAVAVMDTYATVKTLRRDDIPATPWIVVNQAPDDLTASDVFLRLRQSFRRFLDLDVGTLAPIPADAHAAACAATGIPWLLQHPDSPAARRFPVIADVLVESTRVNTSRAAA